MALEDLPFASIREAGLKRLRLAEAPAAAQRQQNINVAGLRTSGVGQLPLIEAARNRALNEAGLNEQISGLEAGQLGAERLAQLNADLALRNTREQFGLESGLQDTLGRQAFQRELVGGGIGLVAGGLKNALITRFPGLGPKKAPLPGYGG